MESSTTTRRPCFIGEDNGLASIAEFSGKINNHNNRYNNNNNNNNQNNGYFVDNQNHMMRRRNSWRNISWISTNISASSSTMVATTAVYSPRSGRLFDPRYEGIHSPHFLESCSLCHKPLGGNRDIFMYRGDTPFCSEECRQEQIDVDEVTEKNRKLKVLRTKKEANNSSSSKSQNYPFRPGTVVAA